MKPAARSVLLSQVILYTGLLVCVLLKPAGLAANDGISYYGIYREVFLPYAVALLGAAYFTVRAIDQLPAHEQILRLSLKIYAPLIAGIVITPYAAGRWMDYLHTGFGSALFSLQLILSGYLVWRLRYAWWAIALTAAAFIAGVLSAIYLNPTHGFLFQTQVIFQLAFGVLLCLSLQRFTTSEPGATKL